MNHLFSTTLKSTQTHVLETPKATVPGLDHCSGGLGLGGRMGRGRKETVACLFVFIHSERSLLTG